MFRNLKKMQPCIGFVLLLGIFLKPRLLQSGNYRRESPYSV